MKNTNRKTLAVILLLLPLLCLAWQRPAVAQDAKESDGWFYIEHGSTELGVGIYLDHRVNKLTEELKKTEAQLDGLLSHHFPGPREDYEKKVTALSETNDLLEKKIARRKFFRKLAFVAGLANLGFGIQEVLDAKQQDDQRRQAAAIRTEREAPKNSSYNQSQTQPDLSSAATASANK